MLLYPVRVVNILKKNYYTLGKKNLQQQSIHTNPYLPLQLHLFQPESGLDSSRRYICKTHHLQFCISPFLTMFCLLSLYQMCSQRASTTNLSQLGQLSGSCVNCLFPDFVHWWLSDPTVPLPTSCLILIASLPCPFCPPSTCYRVTGPSFWLQEEQLSKTIYYFVIKV